ncbi:MAG: CRISPR-associated endonuclease Cas3'', partial [Lachnospiraceae bacterium]
MKIAHIRRKDDTVIVQDLKEHLNHVAALCQEYMRRIGCPTIGYITGLMHDIGKAGATFQQRMTTILAGESDPGQKGGHASAGAIVLNRVANSEENGLHQFLIQAMCEAIFSHHSALPDNISPKGEDGYLARLQVDNKKELEEIEQYFYEEIASKEKIEQLVKQAYREIEILFPKFKETASDGKEAQYFIGLFEKMLLSALIDADWLDSATSGEGQCENFDNIIREENFSREEREQLFKTF